MLWHRGEGLLEYVDAAVTVLWGWAWQDLKLIAGHSGRMGLVVASVKA